MFCLSLICQSWEMQWRGVTNIMIRLLSRIWDMQENVLIRGRKRNNKPQINGGTVDFIFSLEADVCWKQL